MNQTKNSVTEPIKYELLAQAMEEKSWNYEILASATSIAEGTVKNILTGKTTHSSTQNVCTLCNVLEVPIELVLGYSVKTELELKAVKENDAAFIALKELYDAQRAEMKEINEAHIANIRAHYAEHTNDLKENADKRLADKDILIDSLKEQMQKQEALLLAQIADLKSSNRWRAVIIGVFVAILLALMVLEFVYLEHGWITLRHLK